MYDTIIDGTEFQSTLPRGERHVNQLYQDMPIDISIHAPTRGATKAADGGESVTSISIHAPTRGATKIKKAVHKIDPFQSTLPRGERLKTDQLYQASYVFQSTLPRGERPNIQIFGVKDRNFNPRSHEGSDNILFLPLR